MKGKMSSKRLDSLFLSRRIIMKQKSMIEKTARIVFLICGAIAIFAVGTITIYMFVKGTPNF